MRHEKIIKREDGTRVKIIAWINVESFRHTHDYRYQVEVAPPKKKNFRSLVNTDDYTWRRLSMPEREVANMEKYLTIVSKEELLSVSKELWMQLEPKL